MYLETSGDLTLTVLIEEFQADNSWAKGGIMFRNGLQLSSSHYSLYKTLSSGLANQYRTCHGCSTYHHGIYSAYSSVWLRVTKVGNVLRSYYKQSWASYWNSFGAVISINSISSHGYYVGIGVTSRSNSAVATLSVSNIQLTRTCSSETITRLQCDQASNCESGLASGRCYNKGTVPLWENAEPVTNILDVGSTTTSFGCSNSNSGNNALDGATTKYVCDRDGLLEEPTGLIITPSHHRPSTAEGLRVYANNNCTGCDPVSFLFEGRVDSTSAWVTIREGDLPWKTETSFPRNQVLGMDISSTYTSGDISLNYTEVSFYDCQGADCENDPATMNNYMEYKLTWTATRNPNQLSLQVAEIEVPGLLWDEPSMPSLEEFTGDYVSSIVQSTTDIALVGGYSTGSDHNLRAIESSTNKFSMHRDTLDDNDVPGLIVAPADGRASVVTGLRIYPANNSPGGDPVKYRLQGRGMSGANVKVRYNNKCWEVNDFKVEAKINCENTKPSQRFYINERNEIRVKSLPGYCMDARYGYSSQYGVNYMISCISDSHGMEHEETQFQQWSYDASTERLANSYYGSEYCTAYNFDNNNIYMQPCDEAQNPMFYFTDGSFDGTADVGWTLISEGNLPWLSEFDRNPQGLAISSTYESGDGEKNAVEIH